MLPTITKPTEVTKLKLRLPRGLDLHLEFYDPRGAVPVATPGEIYLAVTREPNPGDVAVIDLKYMKDAIC